MGRLYPNLIVLDNFDIHLIKKCKWNGMGLTFFFNILIILK